MYKNCIFDLYGTLIDIRTDESSEDFWREVAAIYEDYGADYPPMQLKNDYCHYARNEKIKQKIRHPLYKHIDINLENVFSKLYEQQGVTPTSSIIADTAVRFRKASTEFIRLYDGVVDLLESLKQHNKKVYLLSNAQRCFTYPEILELDIAKYFDGILISSDCGCSKPQKDFFEKLLTKYSLNKKESIMIGNDCNSDICGAYRAGIDSLYIHQDISSDLNGKPLYSRWNIMDGDVYKIKGYLLRE